MKLCTTCKLEKLETDFHKQKGGKNGLASACKKCRNSYSTEHRRKNPTYYARKRREWVAKNKRRHLNNILTYTFKITVEQFEKMYREQNGVCKICFKPNLDGKRLAVDHNHTTGKVRGLLCNRCNRALGFFDDSLENLRNAFDYLEGNKSIIR